MTLKVVMGLPGTGKTSYGLNYVMEYILQGNNLSEICFCTYRADMAKDIRDKAVDVGLTTDEELKELKFFGKTIHSVCYALLGKGRRNIPTDEDKTLFAKINGLEFEPGENKNSKALFNVFERVRSWRINKRKPLSYVINNSIFAQTGLSVDRYSEIEHGWQCFKEKKKLIDFDDMLITVSASNTAPPCSVLIIDEFQDLSPLQYYIYRLWLNVISDVLVLGDPYQSITGYMGANPVFFRAEAQGNLIDLSITYRLNRPSWEFAKNIIKRNKWHIPELECKNEDGRTPRFVHSLTGHIQKGKKTFILARDNYTCRKAGKELNDAGIVFRGDSSGGWTQKEIDIFNVVYKLKHHIEPIYSSELSSLIAIYDSAFLSMKRKDLNKKINVKTELSYDEAISCLNVKKSLYSEELVDEPLNPDFIKPSDVFSLNEYNRINTALIKRKELITDVPEVKTIHAAKGGECVNTILLGNIPDKALKAMQEGGDVGVRATEEENRIFFVGATRHFWNGGLYVIEDYLDNGKIFEFPMP
jgi:superfamily I DNA/RNA helicase